MSLLFTLHPFRQLDMKMKNILFLIFLLASIGINGQGIEFFEGTWEEALQKAQEEDKIIFVDAYATWCGPCKRMAKFVFTDSEVGAFYNKTYISLKIDMEKPKGRAFGEDFPVSAYPTLFYINEKGELLKRVVGGQNIDQFLALGKEIAESYDWSADLAIEYENGNRDYDLILKYIKALNNANKSSLKVANDYLRKNKELSKEQRALLLYEAMVTADSRIFTLFIRDRATIESLVGKEKVEKKIEDACWNTISNAIDFESEALLSEAKNKMSNHLKAQATQFAYEADYEFAKANADIERLNESAMLIAKKVAKNDAERLHDLCNELLQYKNLDQSVVNSSEKIAKMAVDKEDTPEYLLSYSKILYSNNKSDKALKQARKALQKTKDDQERELIKEWISLLESE